MPVEKRVNEQRVPDHKKSRKIHKDEYEMDEFQKFLLRQGKWRR